jgi:hypothetical protein
MIQTPHKAITDKKTGTALKTLCRFFVAAKQSAGLYLKQLPESRVHLAITGLPLLPCAAGGMHQGSRLRLREVGLLASLTDGSRRGVWRLTHAATSRM